jgi:hypothetical protein
MLVSTYLSIQRKWSYRAVVVTAAALILALVVLKDSAQPTIVLLRVVLAEIAGFCWSLQMAIALVAIGPTLKRLGHASDETVLARVLAEDRVEWRIKGVMIVGTVTFAALLNVAIFLRDVSMYIPVLYFFLVSLVVTLTANVTSRWLLQGVVASSLKKSMPNGGCTENEGSDNR